MDKPARRTEPPRPQAAPVADRILDEAQGAHTVAKEVRDLLQTPREGDQEDPLAPILEALRELTMGQVVMLRRMEAMQRQLDALSRSSAR